MKDFFGKTLNVGDSVLFYNYKRQTMMVAKVLDLGVKMVALEYTLDGLTYTYPEYQCGVVKIENL